MEESLNYIPAFVGVVVVLGILMSGYVKSPPDQAYIISGIKKQGKILIGRAGIKIPFLERIDKLYLGQMTVDIKTEQAVPTSDFSKVNVDAVAKIRIHDTEEGIKLAAKNFLNKDPEYITADLQDSLQGNMREIIGTLSLVDINTDRDSFSDQVMQKASADMEKLGIEIISCNIQNVTDEEGLINALGAENAAKIKKTASISRAEAERDVAIAQSESDKAANDARIKAETEISERNNELLIKQSELKIVADSKTAEADAAYKVQEQEQRKVIETSRINADIAAAERSAKLNEQQVEVTKQKLDAEVRAKADADRYEKEQQAQAILFTRQQDAKAKLFEEEQEAKAERARAEARKFSLEQEAEGTRAVGIAEAEATKAKLLAEAEGIDKKAEAMAKYGEAAIIEIIMSTMPEIAKHVAGPLNNIDKITMYGEGNTAGMMKDIINSTTQVTDGVSAGLGIDLKSVLAGFLGGKVATIDGKKVDLDEVSDEQIESILNKYKVDPTRNVVEQDLLVENVDDEE